MSNFILNKRLSIENKIQCLSELPKTAKFLDSGGYSSVYISSKKSNIPLHVIKVLKISEKMKTKSHIQLKNLSIKNWNENPWTEVHINNEIKTLLNKKYTPNIAYMYCYNFDLPKSEIYLYMELYDMSLSKMFDDNLLKIDQIDSCLFQLIQAYYVLMKFLKLRQGDPGSSNILIKKVTPGGYWKYIVNKKSYYVPNYGYILVVNDFGHSVMKDMKLIMSNENKTDYTDAIKNPIEHLDIVEIFYNYYLKQEQIHIQKHKTIINDEFTKKLSKFISSNITYTRFSDVYNIQSGPNELDTLDILFNHMKKKQSTIIDTYNV